MKIIILLTLLATGLSIDPITENFVKIIFRESIHSLSPETNPDLCLESLNSIKETFQTRTHDQTRSFFEDLFPFLEILESSNVTSTCATPFQLLFNKYATCFAKDTIQENLLKYSVNIIDNIANAIYHIQINQVNRETILLVSEIFGMLCGQPDKSLTKLPSPFDPTRAVPFNSTKFSKEFSRGFFMGTNQNFTDDLAPCLSSIFEFYETREGETTGYEVFKVIKNCARLGKYLEEDAGGLHYQIEREKIVEAMLNILRSAGRYRISIADGINRCLYGEYLICGQKIESTFRTLRKQVFDSLTEEGRDYRVQVNTPGNGKFLE